eukprot:CAMPEP_0181204926 /NCGR_PEP_ID=MMETSP1096-20121128/20198_1 /TAXON_ID=156174 ORGANISM="Chrysochromulina ericina, Strain CCMP281" /NCGR_SAMPLE_ID=MMETSP1096 /ASSEMBLY_ACC=CAM_ASM_000453 /LENGTH=149 /DNA_ID=CAMNT_0023295663 /DNA_START=155 /DNA_END=604 /DNA_ORIENTATION=+
MVLEIPPFVPDPAFPVVRHALVVSDHPVSETRLDAQAGDHAHCVPWREVLQGIAHVNQVELARREVAHHVRNTKRPLRSVREPRSVLRDERAHDVRAKVSDLGMSVQKDGHPLEIAARDIQDAPHPECCNHRVQVTARCQRILSGGAAA